jgi:hypothetical protein
LPTCARGLVVVDESHHFRNSRTRRYAHLAPWLVGRPALLVTATPVVNRVLDLANQLLLSVRDDALALDGIVSLRALLSRGCSAPALGRVIIESDAATEHRPQRISRLSPPTAGECATTKRVVRMVGRLRLSRDESIAALLRGVLLRAGGSSPAALLGALRRYRRLLLHARDALAAGQRLDRAELRRFTMQLGDQLMWWELLPRAEGASEIELGDLDELDDMLTFAGALVQREDGKLARLHEILSDGTPTLVFVASRDTVRYLRDRLGDPRLAWCTGERAGIGGCTIPRRVVLGWFRERPPSNLAPRHLIVTDVAAEGLDLQRAARVVHYDLPWTPMRLEQREGRSVRYGSLHPQVEVIRFSQPPVLEQCLGLEGTLARKARLPTLVGLGLSGRHIWRWRSELADRLGRIDALAGSAAVVSAHQGALAGFTLHRAGERRTCVAASVIWLEKDGAWTEGPEVIAAWLTRAAREQQVAPIDHEVLRSWLRLLAERIRDRLGLARRRRWIAAEPAPAARRLASALQLLIGKAARRHDATQLGELERILRFVAGGHTAGEARLVERLADCSEGELLPALARLPSGRVEEDDLDVRLTGLIVFGPAPQRSSGEPDP